MKKIIAFLFLLSLAQCSTLPNQQTKTTDIGVWQGKVLMVDQKTKNKKWANVTWASDSAHQRMRVDVYAILDIPIATFLKVGNEAHLWLFTEKKYYHSLNGAKLFKTLTKMNINPNVFFSLLGTPVSPNKEWDCKDDESTFKCRSKIQKTVLTVEHEDPNQRVIKALKASKTLRLRLTRSKVGVTDKHFKPLSTSHYKTIEI